MKFPISRKVGSVWADSHLAQKCYEDSLKVEAYPTKVAVNALELDLDLRSQHEYEGPYLAEELKEIRLGPLPTQVTKIGSALSLEEEGMLISFLRENRDVFARSANDMPGIDPNFMCHRLPVMPGARPVIPKKRKQGEEKCKAAREETQKLLTVGFIREVHYPKWLANVVMVRKPSGKWKMCTDYTDLNKACPKDSYPMSSIDRLLDGVVRFALLSFMDAYSGYNQIRMHQQDEEKTAFITDDGDFCYKIMSFGLKNAGATYQRLMDKIFKGVMGTNALKRVFNILRKNKLRLNPGKCSFGVRAGKFLGFIMTERGIEANPEKCQAVVNMRSP
ncbi:hypothetical protein CR513_61911, partial [Mucuna pruriens]